MKAILEAAYPKHPDQTSEMKMTVPEMSNVLDGINRLDITEEKLKEHEDI